ncbi:hypothetical protein ACFL1Q_02870 [Patescibacteria group bacterium]
MPDKYIEKLLRDEKEDVKEIGQALGLSQKPKEPNEKSKERKREIVIFVFFFLIALAVRLYSLFYITTPQNAGIEGWYSDVYHHWQIAYLTKTVGLHQGFLRLWDLKGLEYFWGLIHPLAGVVLITITKTASIVPFRLLSAVSGSFAIAVLFLIVKKYWGIQAGFAAALIAVFNPVGIFSDASGMVEPLGIAFVLLAIYLIYNQPFLSGFLFALASMTRAEYWVLSVCIIACLVIIRVKKINRPLLLLGYLIPIFVYMKYLLDWTGNPIYPVWWNYMGNSVGVWQKEILPNVSQLFAQKIYWVISALSILGVIYVFVKKPKSSPFLLFGFGNWLAWGVVIGMTKYLLSYLPRFWVDRIMLWPYMFLGSLFSILLFGYLRKIVSRGLKVTFSTFAWITTVLSILVLQFLWKPIHFYYDPTQKDFDNFKIMAQEVGKHDTKQGKILFPELWPPFTYMMVYYEGVMGDRIIGQMFDPFYYMGDEDEVFKNWGENRQKIKTWLEEEDIRLLIQVKDNKRYNMLIDTEPDWFEYLGEVRNVDLYKVWPKN